MSINHLSASTTLTNTTHDTIGTSSPMNMFTSPSLPASSSFHSVIQMNSVVPSGLPSSSPILATIETTTSLNSIPPTTSSITTNSVVPSVLPSSSPILTTNQTTTSLNLIPSTTTSITVLVAPVESSQTVVNSQSNPPSQRTQFTPLKIGFVVLGSFAFAAGVILFLYICIVRRRRRDRFGKYPVESDERDTYSKYGESLHKHSSSQYGYYRALSPNSAPLPLPAHSRSNSPNSFGGGGQYFLNRSPSPPSLTSTKVVVSIADLKPLPQSNCSNSGNSLGVEAQYFLNRKVAAPMMLTNAAVSLGNLGPSPRSNSELEQQTENLDVVPTPMPPKAAVLTIPAPPPSVITWAIPENTVASPPRSSLTLAIPDSSQLPSRRPSRGKRSIRNARKGSKTQDMAYDSDDTESIYSQASASTSSHHYSETVHQVSKMHPATSSSAMQAYNLFLNNNSSSTNTSPNTEHPPHLTSSLSREDAISRINALFTPNTEEDGQRTLARQDTVKIHSLFSPATSVIYEETESLLSPKASNYSEAKSKEGEQMPLIRQDTVAIGQLLKSRARNSKDVPNELVTRQVSRIERYGSIRPAFSPDTEFGQEDAPPVTRLKLKLKTNANRRSELPYLDSAERISPITRYSTPLVMGNHPTSSCPSTSGTHRHSLSDSNL